MRTHNSPELDEPARAPEKAGWIRSRLPAGWLISAAALCVLLMWLSPTRETVGISAIALVLVLMLMKLPIAFALAIPGLLGIFMISGPRAAVNTLSSLPFSSVSQWSLSVLPMFILMGTLLGASGIIGRVYHAARLWLGWLPGGLAMGTNVAGGSLAAVSGSTIAISHALGRVGVPEMLRRQYDPKFAIGSVIVAGLPGQLIPPSTFLIIVAGVLGTAVGPQLIAGFLPGVGLVLFACVSIVIYAIIFPRWAGRTPEQRAEAGEGHHSTAERVKSLGGVWPVVALFAVVFGGIFGGVVTATEAGSLGAFIALLLILFYKRGDRPWSHILRASSQTVVSTGAIFFVLLGAQVLTQMVAVTGIGAAFSGIVTGADLGRVEFLLVVVVMYIILGMFMDPLAILLLTLPILQPTFAGLGIDPLWFGVFAVLMGELAILTPPVGLLTFIMHKLMQDEEITLGRQVSLKDVFIAVSLFFPAILLVVVVIIFVPGLVTWLPGIM